MEGIVEYTTPASGERTYIIKITKHVAVRARSESEALRKAQSCDFSRLGRDVYVLLGKINNTDKETD